MIHSYIYRTQRKSCGHCYTFRPFGMQTTHTQYAYYIKLRWTWTRCKHGHQYLSYCCRWRRPPFFLTSSCFLSLFSFGHYMIDGLRYDIFFCNKTILKKHFTNFMNTFYWNVILDILTMFCHSCICRYSSNTKHIKCDPFPSKFDFFNKNFNRNISGCWLSPLMIQFIPTI